MARPDKRLGHGYRSRRRGRGWQGGDVRHARRHSRITYQPHRAVSVEIPGRKGNGAPSPPEALAIKPSVISGNRTQMRRRPFRKIEEHLVDITTAPPFRWIIGFDDRALGRRPVGVFAEPCAAALLRPDPSRACPPGKTTDAKRLPNVGDPKLNLVRLCLATVANIDRRQFQPAIPICHGKRN